MNGDCLKTALAPYLPHILDILEFHHMDRFEGLRKQGGFFQLLCGVISILCFLKWMTSCLPASYPPYTSIYRKVDILLLCLPLSEGHMMLRIQVRSRVNTCRSMFKLTQLKRLIKVHSNVWLQLLGTSRLTHTSLYIMFQKICSLNKHSFFRGAPNILQRWSWLSSFLSSFLSFW